MTVADQPPAPVEVTQTDREAAAEFRHGGRGAIPTHEVDEIAAIRSGRWDRYPLVQAFARHRLATADAESVERLRVAVNDTLAEIRLAHDALNLITTNRRRYGAVATQTLTAGHALASAERRLRSLAALAVKPQDDAQGEVG